MFMFRFSLFCFAFSIYGAKSPRLRAFAGGLKGGQAWKCARTYKGCKGDIQGLM